MRKTLIDLLVYGPAILNRFAGVTIPPALQPYFDAFKAAQTGFEQAAGAADEARQARDAAVVAVGEADADLDGSITGLASKMVGAELGPRANPFGPFSRHSVSVLCNLPYATEIPAVRELVAKVAAKGAPQDVTQKIGECLQQATRVESALAELSLPQSEYDQKLAIRNEAAMAWSKAYAKLRLHSEVAFEDQPGVFEALFAKPESMQRPVKKRGKKQPAGTPSEPE